MDLIDREELLKNDDVTEWLSNDAIRTGKMLKAFSELFVKKVKSAQKVDAIPMSVIEEIESEIANCLRRDTQGKIDYNSSHNLGLYEAYDIIEQKVKEYEDAT